MMRANLSLILIAAAPLLHGCTPPAHVRVMSFNVRFASPADGENRWENRRDAVLTLIRDGQPDVLGLQEVLASQAADLRAGLPEYEFIGVGREDGAEKGEFVPLMYRRQRFELVDSGWFWLSQTPQQPGSMGWDAACPRIATWARLRPREMPARMLRVINVHLDHQGILARAASAQLLRRWAAANAGEPLIVTGDFNCGPDSQPYRALLDPGTDGIRLRDAGRSDSQPGPDEGTYHAFTGQPQSGRIDWILASDDFRVLSADIDRTSFNAHYPSDHFPVWAELSLLRPQVGNPRPRPAE